MSQDINQTTRTTSDNLNNLTDEYKRFEDLTDLQNLAEIEKNRFDKGYILRYSDGRVENVLLHVSVFHKLRKIVSDNVEKASSAIQETDPESALENTAPEPVQSETVAEAANPIPKEEDKEEPKSDQQEAIRHARMRLNKSALDVAADFKDSSLTGFWANTNNMIELNKLLGLGWAYAEVDDLTESRVKELLCNQRPGETRNAAGSLVQVNELVLLKINKAVAKAIDEEFRMRDHVNEEVRMHGKSLGVSISRDQKDFSLSEKKSIAVNAPLIKT